MGCSYKLGHQRLSSFFALHYKNIPIWDRGRQITLRGGLPDIQEPGLTLRGMLLNPSLIDTLGFAMKAIIDQCDETDE